MANVHQGRADCDSFCRRCSSLYAASLSRPLISIAKKIAAGIKLGLNENAAKILAQLSTPEEIQDFICALKPNFEADGDTCRSVNEALSHGEVHCIEGAFIAACAFWLAGQKPLLLDFQARGDFDHVVAVFRTGNCWGAISKSNHVWLRYRNPVYRSLRELAMSYFHEYAGVRKKDALKSLYTYSRPFDLRRFEPSLWVSQKEPCWDIAAALDSSRHFSLVTLTQAKRLRKSDPIELRAHLLLDQAPPSKIRKNKGKIRRHPSLLG